ncbi:hypothetical protein pdam_00005488 [Pocillopora damicornis]|uniref:Uncharacterized protein n=1 Tax=Pocillopora damicornis TaxID=46731 RepID=A0A3M6TAF1_POCDA|nr:hypothetical protein pdam_00005488 [Pocillopora damicornis]
MQFIKLIFFPHDKATLRSRKVCKYAFKVVGVASRFKAAEPLTSKDSSEISKSFSDNLQEMNFKGGKRSTEWVKRLPEVVSALNSEVTRLTGKKPVVAIKDKSVDVKSSTTYSRPIGLKEKRLDFSNVRYLFAAGELEGGQKTLVNKNEPVLYYLKDGPKCGFVREELQIVPPGTELPPEGICQLEKT